MSLAPILSGLGLSAMLAVSSGANYNHQKREVIKQTTASSVEKLITLNDTTRHTFVIDENNSITLLLNQFQTVHGGIEKYLQLYDCVWNEYTIYVHDDYYQVSIIDNKNESVVRYNVKISPNNNESNDDDDDVKEKVPTVSEILKRIQSQGVLVPFITEDGIVYKFDCV